MTQTYALTTLDRLDAPDIVTVAKGMLSGRSPYASAEARRILKKRGVIH